MKIENNNTIDELNAIIASFGKIPSEKKYWLVRTFSGKYFDSFVNNNYIALGHEEVLYSDITKINIESGGNNSSFLKLLTNHIKDVYPNENRHGLIASQIFKFVYKIKKGDIVIIPSTDSEFVAFGEVTQTPVLETSDNDIFNTKCPYKKRKSVKWIKQLKRDDLDPFLYRILSAHQAINNITKYNSIIERAVGNFFITDDSGNLVLEVTKSNGINAFELFELGFSLMTECQQFFDQQGLPLDVSAIEVKININSKGKLHFINADPRVLWIIAIFVLAINGGGLRFNGYGIDFDLSTNGIIQKVIDYQNSNHDREMMTKLSKNFDSLQISAPDDAVKIYQQFNTNKK